MLVLAVGATSMLLYYASKRNTNVTPQGYLSVTPTPSLRDKISTTTSKFITDQKSEGKTIASQIIISFIDGKKASFNSKKYKLSEVEKLSDNIYLYKGDITLNLQNLVSLLNQDPVVVAAELDYPAQIVKQSSDTSEILTDTSLDTVTTLTPAPTSADPLFRMQRNLYNPYSPDYDLDIDQSWKKQGTRKIIVAVLDSGFTYYHEDIAIWKNPKEIANNKIDDDLNGYVDDIYSPWRNFVTSLPHGTWVAGLISPIKDNNKGIASICKTCVTMQIPFQAGVVEIPEDQFAMVSKVIKGMEYARKMGARVINCSFTLPYYSEALQQEINILEKSRIVVVAAAGNEGENPDPSIGVGRYPAMNDFVIAVGAANRNGKHSIESNFGNWVDIWAISQAIPMPNMYDKSNPHYSLPLKDPWTNNNESYLSSGAASTSISAPQVSATVGAMLSSNPRLTPEQIRKMLIESANRTPASLNSRAKLILNAGRAQELAAASVTQ